MDGRMGEIGAAVGGGVGAVEMLHLFRDRGQNKKDQPKQTDKMNSQAGDGRVREMMGFSLSFFFLDR
jgi:hypothetical protein